MSGIVERTSGHAAGGKMLIAAAVLVSVGAFVVGPALFAPSGDLPTPSSTQLPFFIGLAAAEAAVMGVAVVFAFRGRPAVQRLFSSRGRATAVHAAVVWALGSWWLHDNLHMANGANITGLLVLEYAFHITVIAAVALVARALVVESRDRRA